MTSAGNTGEHNAARSPQKLPLRGSLSEVPSSFESWMPSITRGISLLDVPEDNTAAGTSSDASSSARGGDRATQQGSGSGSGLNELPLSSPFTSSHLSPSNGDNQQRQQIMHLWNSSFTEEPSEDGSEEGTGREIPCFGDYVACAFLGRSLEEVPYRNHDDITSTYHGLFMLGQLYLMKDIRKLHECMRDFELKRVVRLFEATKQRITKAMHKWSFRPAIARSATMAHPMPKAHPAPSVPFTLEVTPSARPRSSAAAARAAEPQTSAAEIVRDMEVRHSQQMVHRMVVDIMKELEACAFEYLSYNWNRADEVYAVNKAAMEEVGILASQSPDSVPFLHRRRTSCPTLDDLPFGFSKAADNARKQEGLHTNSSPELRGDSPTAKPIGRAASAKSFSTAEAVLRHRIAGGSSKASSSAGDGSSVLATAAEEEEEEEVEEEVDEEGDAERRSARARANWQRGRIAAAKKVTMDMLGVTRKSKTLKEVFDSLKTPGGRQRHEEVLQSTLQPAGTSKDPNRQPTLLLLGGGMAAGKSTVREVIGNSDFWSRVAPDAVVVEADALKASNNKDTSDWSSLLSSLKERSRGGSCNNLSKFSNDSFSHEYSTMAAEAILVAAINEQKDVIFDGTMSWAPFVEQTIAMARDHNNAYVCGPGYVPSENDAPPIERYWEPLPVDEQKRFLETHPDRRPYRIELVGVTCDPGLAVSRGLWRYLTSGRSVPIDSQLRSHKLFATNFERYARLVDSATLYFTGCALTTFNKGHMNTAPQVIAHSSHGTWGEVLTNDAAYRNFKLLSNINNKAPNRSCLYKDGDVDQEAPSTHFSGENCERKTVPRSKEPRIQGLRAAFQWLESHSCDPGECRRGHT